LGLVSTWEVYTFKSNEWLPSKLQENQIGVSRAIIFGFSAFVASEKIVAYWGIIIDMDLEDIKFHMDSGNKIAYYSTT